MSKVLANSTPQYGQKLRLYDPGYRDNSEKIASISAELRNQHHHLLCHEVIPAEHHETRVGSVAFLVPEQPLNVESKHSHLAFGSDLFFQLI